MVDRTFRQRLDYFCETWEELAVDQRLDIIGAAPEFYIAAFHAEVAALRSLNTTVPHSRLTLYSARVDKEGNKKLAKPCARCMAVLDYVGLHNIYWTEETI